MPGLRERIGAAFNALKNPRWSGFGGRYSGPASGSGRRHPLLYYFLANTGIDWQTKAGDLWKNSAVGIFLNWIQLSFPEAVPGLARLKPDGTIEFDHAHELSALLRYPSREHSPASFWNGTVNSFICDGNAYWRKIRSRMGIDSLRYLPHYEVEPRWPDDGSEFISHYEHYVNGQWERVEVEDIVHLRYGVNPDNIRKGLSPLNAQFRQVVTDNENSNYNATLSENNGTPGLMISPADKDVDVDPDEMEKWAKKLAAKSTGDKRFRPEVAPVGVKVDKLTWSPEEMALDKLLNQPAWRIGAALGIDPLVVGLPSENEGSYDNTEQAERKAWNNAILPWMAMISADATRQLFPDFELMDPFGKPAEGFMVGFDTRNVRALRINLETLLPVLAQASGGPVLTPNEARGLANYEEMDGGDELRLAPTEVTPTEPGDSGDGGSGGNSKGKGKGK